MMRNALQGKTIAFTGDLGAMTRKEATNAAQAVGAVVSSSVSRNIDFLVAGNNATPAKTMKAQQNGVALLSAPQFLQFAAAAPAAPTSAMAHSVAVPQQQQQQPQAPTATQHRGSAASLFTPPPQGAKRAAGRIEYPAEALAHQASLQLRQPKAVAYQQQQQQQQQVEMVEEAELEEEQPVYHFQPELQPAPVQEEPLSYVSGQVGVADKTVAVTGTLEGYSRAEAIDRLLQAGASVMTAVSGNTDYLVCGYAPTETKIEAAQRKGVSLISEAQFIAATQPQQMMAQPHVQQQQQFVAPPNGAVGVPTLAGKSISITGTLANYSRAEATVYAKQAGAHVGPKVSAALDYLVCGANPTGHKVAAAQALGVQIIAEHQFAAAIPRTSVVPAPLPVMAQQQQPMATPATFTPAAVTLTGKIIAITGTLDTYTRADASAHAKLVGATVSSAVTATTDYLICGASPTPSKVAAAQAHGVELVAEEQFLAALAHQLQPAALVAPVEAEVPQYAAAPPHAHVAIPRRSAALAPSPVDLAGKTVVFTGALNVNRLVAAVMATKSGATVTTVLNNKTDYVVCGSGAGAKMAQAQALGIRSVSENEFVTACRQ